MNQKNIGFFGSCQLHLCCDFFLNNEVKNKNNINVKFSLPFYEYDPNYKHYRGILCYSIFDDLDILVIEKNVLTNEASSEKIINYLQGKNIKIIKTFLIKFPIFPLNWSGYGENKKDYLIWDGLDNINYKQKFKKCIENMYKENNESDLSTNLTDFVKNNFNKKLLFTHSLHPTNILLYQLWKYILRFLSINIEDHKYIFEDELLICRKNPFTIKMIKDLDIQFKYKVDDQFYIDRFELSKKYLHKNVNWHFLTSGEIKTQKKI